MTLTAEYGQIPIAYDPIPFSAIGTNGLMDATAEKVAFVGNIWHPTVKTGTINIRKVLFRTGAVTLNAASQVRVSLQNVSATAGPPAQPDGVQDQFYDFKTATVTLAANTWQSTGALSADRAVNLANDSTTDTDSRRLAVVFEYQVFTAADSVIISNASNANAMQTNYGGYPLLNTGTWAVLSQRHALIAFECDDGSLAFMQGGVPIIASTGIAVGNAAAVRRAGVRFKVPTERTLDRIAMSIKLPNGADGRFVLYDSDGTTELRSIDMDNDEVFAAISDNVSEFPIEPVTLAAETYYRLAFVSTTATTATVNYLDVGAAAVMDSFIFGQSAHWTQHNGTAWAETTTRRPWFGLGFGSYHAPGGGLLVNSGMTGGIRG